jgi:hypothetical protein
MAAGLTAAALITTCATACGDDPASEAKPSTTPAPATSSEPTPEPEPTPTREPILKMDTSWGFEGTEDGADIEGEVTVLDYKQGIKSVAAADEEANADGYEWAYVELKTCSTAGSFLASTEPWTLFYEDGTRIEPSSTTYDDFPKPEYPFETQLTTGKCVRGKLVFAVPGDAWPHTVVYAPYGLDTPQEWAVPTEG